MENIREQLVLRFLFWIDLLHLEFLDDINGDINSDSWRNGKEFRIFCYSGRFLNKDKGLRMVNVAHV